MSLILRDARGGGDRDVGAGSNGHCVCDGLAATLEAGVEDSEMGYGIHNSLLFTRGFFAL